MRSILTAAVAVFALAFGGVAAPAAGAQVLGEGAAGPAVAEWQDDLNQWLQVNRPESGRLAEDGIFGPRTEAATIQFQRAQDITIDGLVGPETRSAYRGTPASEPDVPAAEPLLLRGSAGQAVSRWQSRLNDAGADIAVDGIYGPNTEAATRAFQGEAGILVDGIVGPQTRRAMASR